jgi:hypothetical protein
MTTTRRYAHPLRALIVAGATLGAGAAALALEEPADEWDRLKACEKDLCTMVLEQEAAGSDLKCAISKTWARSSLKGGEKKGVLWGFGDAQCGLDLTLSRADVVAALTRPEHTVQVPLHTVKCQVERGEEIERVTIKLSPKLKFKHGKADKVWINVKEIAGPEDVKGTVAVAASLEDTLGIFHKPLIKSINKFLHTQCAQRYGPEAEERKAQVKTPGPAGAGTSEAPVSASTATAAH